MLSNIPISEAEGLRR